MYFLFFVLEDLSKLAEMIKERDRARRPSDWIIVATHVHGKTNIV